MNEDNNLLVQYTSRDAILYSLSIGSTELQYVYEKHQSFSAHPCMVLTFLFRAASTNHYSLADFPPPIMTTMGLVPPECLIDNKKSDLSQYDLLHIAQSVRWYAPLPISKRGCAKLQVTGRCTAVVPKSVGAFVTHHYTIRYDTKEKHTLCNMQSTTLVRGFPPIRVRPLGTQGPRLQWTMPKQAPLWEGSYRIPHNQALWYRMASCDTNSIHVMTSTEKRGPILHGLCTLAISCRLLLEHIEATYGDRVSLQRLDGHFVQPVYMGETLMVRAWCVRKNNRTVELVFQSSTTTVVLDGGHLVVSKDSPSSRL